MSTVSGVNADPSAAAAAATAATQQSNLSAGLATEGTFLKLLVAQIQNQDPLQPTDSMQFVTQLAQFSSLEQLMSINQGVSTLDSSLQAGNSTTTQTNNTGSPVQG